MAERLALEGGHPAISQSPDGSGRRDGVVVGDALAALGQLDPDAELSSLSGAGPVQELEARMAVRAGARYAVATSSGTAALYAALAALGTGPGDEVIVSAYDWGAAAAAVRALGATPVFADVDGSTYTLDPADVAARCTPRTVGMVATHLFGHPAQLDALGGLAGRLQLFLVEDCAHGLGAEWRGRPVGASGAAGCFSLGAGKTVSGGEGGVLVTDHEDVYLAVLRGSQHPLRQLREGVPGPDHFGLNLRCHPLAAVLALASLERLPALLSSSQAAAADAERALASVPGFRPVGVVHGTRHAFYRYSPTYVVAEWEGVDRNLAVSALAAEGVPVGAGPIGVALSERWRNAGHGDTAPCPAAEERCRSAELVFSLPAVGRITQGLASALQKVWMARQRLRALGAAATIRF